MRGPGRALKRRRSAASLALLALLGCGEARDAAPPPAGSAKPPAAAAAPTPRLQVALGADGSLRVVARRAPRFRVLQELARAAGFAVAAGVGRAPARDLDLDLAAASIEEALEQVLGDVPHHLHYAAPAEGGQVALRRVTIGLLPELRAHGAPPPAEERVAPRDAPPPPRDEAERAAEVEARRGSREPGDRARAAAWMRPEEDFDALRELLANDPDPEVRRSAAESLGEVDGGEVAFRAGDALLEATLDADPAVAAAAIRALEDVHDVVPDPRFRARVAALAGHPDPRVRAAAASFLEWTEDDW